MENGRKIDDRELYRLLTKEGWSQREVAKHFGVSDQAVSDRVKKLRIVVARHTGLEKAKEITDLGIDIARQFQDVNRAIKEQFDKCIEESKNPELDGPVLRQSIVALGGELRKQHVFLKELQEAWNDMKAVREFQATVLEVIDEVSPAVKKEIVRRLAERRAIRSALIPYERGAGGITALMSPQPLNDSALLEQGRINR